jgi:D-alanyl-D-alanine carboxypeptidase
MLRLLAVPLAAVAFHASAQQLSAPVQKELLAAGVWHQGCPVELSQLRVLSVTYWGFDGHRHPGTLVVNEAAVAPLTSVFRRLYELRFPIRHLRLADAYGPVRQRPKDGDVSGSFECRDAVPSPCNGGKSTGSWSMHAYGLAIDVNPRENPYVGCGMSRDPAALSYMNRSKLREGMVTPEVVDAFRSAGWGWGGSWSGSTKDYMHFSSTGH